MATARAADQPALRFDGVARAYAGRVAVDCVTLAIPRGAFAVIVGPSGCGKTTLLKMVNRLLEPTGGRVFVDGVDTASLDPVALRRRIGYAIQQVGLFAHMTVAENVAVVPNLLGWRRDRILARTAELLDLVHLDAATFGARYPRQLSGGQQQRVGLARALAGDPDLLLMDEPFGAVDAIERAHLQEEIAALQRRLGKTILFVTHDVDEALRLGDLIIVMRAGAVEQAGTPLDVLARPASAFVAELVDAHDVLRRLRVVKVSAAMRLNRDSAVPAAAASTVDAGATLRDALSRMATSGERVLGVVDGGALLGAITLDDVLEGTRRMPGDAEPA